MKFLKKTDSQTRNHFASSMQKYPTKMLALDFDFFAKIVYLSEKLEITLLNSSGYVILYPLSFAEDVKLRPGEDVTSSKRRCKCFLKSVQYQVSSFKLADLAGPGKSKKKVKRTKDPRNPTGDEKHNPWR